MVDAVAGIDRGPTAPLASEPHQADIDDVDTCNAIGNFEGSMGRLLTRISFVLGLTAQVTAIWLSLAPGLVFCVEQDGQVTLEASGAGASCGGAAPEFGPTSSRPSIAEAASPHCIGCTDVPLQVADRAVAQHQRGVTETQVFATSLHPAVLPQVQPHRIPVHAVVARALRAAVQRTTILRI